MKSEIYKINLRTICALIALVVATACSKGDDARGGNVEEGERQDSRRQAEREQVGTVAWAGSDPQPLHEVRCGSRGDEFLMNALGDDFNLRLYFRDPDGGTSIDFSKRRSFDLRFSSDHRYSEVRFYYPNFLESDGHVSASPQGAKGEAELINAINIRDTDLGNLLGSTLYYEFRCSHDLNARRL